MRIARFARWPVVVAMALAACTAPPAAPTPDFGFALTDTLFEALPGSSLTTSVTLTPINGFAGSVALTLTDRDGGAADPGLTLDPATITVAAAFAGQSLQRQLTLDVGAGVANGSYELRITATSGALASDADLTLTVADDLIPLVAITGPADGTTVAGDRRVEIVGTLASLDPIVSVDLLGGADLLDIAFDQGGFVATAELGNNANTLRIGATDASGRVGVSAPVTLSYPFLDLADFQGASVVIGQPDFVSNQSNRGGAVAADTLASPIAPVAATSSGGLYLADFANNRVLGYHQLPSGNGAPADFVLGQADLGSNVAATSATGMNGPTSVHTDDTRLAVSETFNHRVLLWNSLPTATQVPADVVVGQPDASSSASGCDASSLKNPTAVMMVGDRLIVADNANHRVLIWNEIPSGDGVAAGVVVGQGSFGNCVANDTDQNGAGDGAPNASTLHFPNGVWSDGTRLVVADSGNQRVLIWNVFPTTNFTPADLVLGQPDFTTTGFGADAQRFDIPRDVYGTVNDQLLIADTTNDRVLVFDRFPIANAQAADRVLGQSTFTGSASNDDDQDGVSDGLASGRTLSSPFSVSASASALFVTDTSNHRILVFESR